MEADHTTRKRIAEILRKKESPERIRKAAIFETGSKGTTLLHLRNLDLNSQEVVTVANIFKAEIGSNHSSINSISFSNNVLLGDLGATALGSNLPTSLHEIGLVNCGISDVGGTEILNWMKKSTHLQMICMEGNSFSDQMKEQFNIFKKANSHIMVVI